MVVIIPATKGQTGIPVGFPILLSGRMEIIEAAFAYLLELAIVPGRSHSSDTVRTYAEHLYDWFDSLDQSDLDWKLADEEMIAAYRNRMLEQPSPHTGRPYARSRSMIVFAPSAGSIIGRINAVGSSICHSV
ncbi:hypothetical protein [Sinorhizobium meliloti]|uniref:hypothetical protein n=1 Tax=Rhizobium meliloti TaxID=382 RepID=UPI00309AEA00